MEIEPDNNNQSNKESNQQKNNSNIQINKEEIQKKLKQDTINLFNQINLGCKRNFCYNIYCGKNIYCKLKYKNSDKKSILTEVLKLVKNGVENFQCINFDETEKIENFFKEFEDENINHNFNFFDDKININENENVFPKLTLNLKKISDFFTKANNQNISIENDLKNFNKYNKTFFDLLNKKKEFDEYNQNENIILYLYSYLINELIYIISHPNFYFTETNASEFLIFFDNFMLIKKKLKEIFNNKFKIIFTDNNNLKIKNNYFKNNLLNSFSNLKNFPEKFKDIVSNCQNFLTLILFNIGSVSDDEDYKLNKQMENLLQNFVKIFKIFFYFNDKLNIISYRCFYNDGMSKYLNFKRECKIYISNKKMKFKNKKFCLIDYLWLFDPAAKNDILQHFNSFKQNEEIISNLFDISFFEKKMFFEIKIHRENIIEDTMNTVSREEKNLRKPLKVKFIGEQGVDEGGVRKEFFMLLVRKLFDPNYGMFKYNNETRLFWFNMYSFEPKIKFELIGVILGLAMFNNTILDVKFPLIIYKKLLGRSYDLEDLKEVEPDIYKNLKFLLSTDDDNVIKNIYMNFTVTTEKFGEKIIIPLKPNGENIFIDNSNKKEYIDLYLNWYFNLSIDEFFVYFKNGFYKVCLEEYNSFLSPEELELIICGNQILDFHELKKAVKYEDGFTKDSKTIVDFWEIAFQFTEEEKKKFLFFVTGCDRAPINGLGYLEITIGRMGPDSDKLPTSHTCFNVLLIPDYQNKEKLKKCLTIAINYSEGFGLI